MPSKSKNATVWTEIPVTDLSAAVKFYAEVFDWDLNIDTDGPNPMAMFPYDGGVGGHLYPGTPAQAGGPTVHLAVPDTVEATRNRLRKAGGEAQDMIIPIPVGRFCYATDPDGNSIGLLEQATG